MYHVNAQGVDEHMINVHYHYYYYCDESIILPHSNTARPVQNV